MHLTLKNKYEFFDKSERRDGLSINDVTVLIALAEKKAHKKAVFVEVGSWKGHSSCVIASVLKKQGGELYCVDHWKGSPGVFHHGLETDCFQTFRNNIRECKLEKYIHPLEMDSYTASKIFKDEIADFIFIDADHRYKNILKDLKLWYPKVKKGGILCGHDCEWFFSNYTLDEQKQIEYTKNEDYNHDIKCHSGVIKALYDFFNDDYLKTNDAVVWVKKK